MEEKIIKILKAFQVIEPGREFTERSRGAIFVASKRQVFNFRARFWEGLKFASALTLASFLIFIILGGVSYFNIKNLSPVLLTGLNDDNLLAEANSLDFKIQLDEIRYYEESAKEVAALLDELTKNGNEHNL